MKTNVSVIIPAYNEEGGIQEVVREVQAALASTGAPHEIIVVDDGSSDATAAKAKETGVRVIEHPVNRGYGQSLMTGIRSAASETIVTIDADISYNAWDIVKLLPYAEKFDLVVGQRTGKEYRGRLLKYPARIVFRFLAEYISGERIPDINSGLRVFRRSILLAMPGIHLCRRFSFSTTMTLMFLAGGYNTHFVPIEYRTRSGQSKIRYVRDTLRALQILFEIAVHYNPVKAILPLCLPPLLGTAVFFIVWLFETAQPLWLLMSALSLFVLLVIFAIGMLLLQIRMSAREDTTSCAE